MGKRSATRPAPGSDGARAGRPSWAGRVRAWSRWDEPEAEAPPGRPWPAWACWLVSAVLLFHMTALVACELAGQTDVSALETEVGLRFWWYVVLIGQEYTHAYFAPDPENATPVVTARLEFADGRPDREVRIPDRSTRPRIRYVRQIALAWHLTHEWSPPDPIRRSYWAASYAKHLCRANPGCARVRLFVRLHQSLPPGAVVDAVARGEPPDLDADEMYSGSYQIGEFSCDDL